MHAVRLARAATHREKVILCSESYHGSHDVSITAHLGPARAAAGGVPEGVTADVLLATFNDLESFERIFSEYPDSIAAVLIEPMQRCIEPKPNFLQSLIDLAHRQGSLVIFDEVMTGFRLAFGGAQERFGAIPDLVCYGKILGGGLPLAAVGGRRAVMQFADASDKARQFVHISGTMNGNPLSAAAGLATLNELSKASAYEGLNRLGERLRVGLRQQLDAAGATAEVRGVGPLAAVVLSTHDPEDPPVRRINELTAAMLKSGILVQLQTRFYVSTAHTDEEIDHAVQVFGEALTARAQVGHAQ